MGFGDVITGSDEARTKIEAAVQRALDDFEADATGALALPAVTQERHIVAHYPPRSAPPAHGGDARQGAEEGPEATR